MGTRQEPVVFLDTHVVVWLYEGLERKFSARVKKIINSDELRISPLVGLELQYLYDVGKEVDAPEEILGVAETSFGIFQAKSDYLKVVQVARGQGWTRDPFDRLMVAEAVLHEAKLVTADKLIRKHYTLSVW